MHAIVSGVEVKGALEAGFEEILTPPALSFVAELARAFEGRRQELLAARAAWYSELDAGGGEDGRSVNVGLSPGDGAYREPYWYVTPWPAPARKARPTLPVGHWHTEGFTAAVLPASRIDAGRLDTEVDPVLAEAVAASLGLLA